ncbi:unnamed protein product [Fraxinus pennsylvanica]|uniref:General transcription factor 3C polypeptide 3 n=1 Tax=Fraxinus pennsylvanica TaxID=56036 RepID=A0AAD2EDL0_9LAMI|nr:unnamed protein product [Fraxinus pennsylvanica]
MWHKDVEPLLGVTILWMKLEKTMIIGKESQRTDAVKQIGKQIPPAPRPEQGIMEDNQGTVVMTDYCADELPLELGLEEEEDNDNDDDDGENNGASEDEEEQGDGFRFQGEMNPLAFVEEHDAAGLQPYERFEQIQYHYEALAAKKRNSPASPHHYSRETLAKRLRQEEIHGASFEEIMEAMNYGMRRKSKKTKKKGRRKGSKKKVNSELTRKLGDATLHYAHGRYEEAISVLNEVILLAPNLSDPYHTLGLIYNEMGDKKRALNFYMIAAHLTPKDASLWKLLVTWSMSKASRAKRLLRKKATIKEAKKAAALAAGIDWKSDDSDDECPQDMLEPPLPILKNEEHHHLIIDLSISCPCILEKFYYKVVI